MSEKFKKTLAEAQERLDTCHKCGVNAKELREKIRLQEILLEANKQENDTIQKLSGLLHEARKNLRWDVGGVAPGLMARMDEVLK